MQDPALASSRPWRTSSTETELVFAALEPEKTADTRHVRMIMPKLLPSFVLCAALCSSTLVRADAFTDAYQAGVTSLADKDYSKARAEFLRAYDLRPEPSLLFNVAQTYRFESNVKEAT